MRPSAIIVDSKLLAYINSARKYPEEVYKKGVKGKVTCSFVVNRDGSISHVRGLSGVERSLNKEAIGILSKMPLWHAGKLKGEKVPVRMVRSVTFLK